MGKNKEGDFASPQSGQQDIQNARRYLKGLAKAQLGFFPTPFYRLDNLSRKLGVELYIKRDDFTGASLFGGNKIRKLEYLIGDAKKKGAEYVFTFGATQSNHAMQTVCSCNRLGIKPVLYLVAIVKPDEEDLRSNLLLDKILGAKMHIIEPEEGETEAEASERALQLARAHMKRLEEQNHICYEIPMGGASEVGSTGFIEGYIELEEQMRALGIKADYIFHATGTGGTMAGIQAGRKLLSSECRVISIEVGVKKDDYAEKTAELANKSLDLIGAKDVRVSAREDIHTDGNYYLPGYEIPNEASSRAIRMLAKEEGLFIDPVYTGKAFAGMLDYIESGKIAPKSTVVFWHTGGATGLFAEKQILGDLV